jgi:hypothetical protein
MLAGGAIAWASVLVPVGAAHAVPSPITLSSSTLAFDNCVPAEPGVCPTRLGHFRLSGFGGETQLVVTNNSAQDAQVNPVFTVSNGSTDFLLAQASTGISCLNFAPNGIDLVATTIAPGDSCNLGVAFVPTHFGARSTVMTVKFSDSSSVALSLSGTGVGGYYLAGAASEWATFGFAPEDLESDGLNLVRPVVGIAGDDTGNGFWLDASDGGVFTAGDAAFFGSTGNIRLNRPVVGMAGTPSGRGYWLVASDGGVFTFGDARFFGSTGNIRLNQPIVGMAATPTGKGYWMVASDGGIFTFGDARFFGSTGNVKLAMPIVGMSASPTSQGYYLVASDGGIFTFGDVPFEGSLGGQGINDVVGIAPTTLPLFAAVDLTPASVGGRSSAFLAAVSSGRLTPDSATKAR